MQRPLSVPLPLLESADDSDDSPSDSSNSTPHSSFLLLDPDSDPAVQDEAGFCRRHYSLVSFDSGYFSTMGKDSPLAKLSSRNPSSIDLRHPLIPASSTDATHGSPKRDGAIMNFLRKRKKSMSYFSDTESLHHRNPAEEPPVPHIQPFPLWLPPPRSKDRDPSIETFEERDRFVVRRGMKHHPYSRDDVPYMVAYDSTLLDNDKFSEILLRRLNPTHSPSFHDFSHAPPRAILDLGCGSGGWAVEAASFWPSSQVIGFDLLSPVRLRGVESPSNVQWKQGNFIKFKLPFAKNTFDLVRMANLSLCVPHDRWEHVISEARRVLAQDGRLELIDDYLYFPYGKRPSPDSHGSPLAQSSSFDHDDDDDDGEAKEDTENNGGQDDDEDEDDDDDADFVSTKSRFSYFVDPDGPESPSSHDPVSEWSRNVDNFKALEKLFEDMLSYKFAIHPRPSKLFDGVLDKVFGRYHQRRLHEFNLYLAPPLSVESEPGSSEGSSDGHGSAGLKKARRDFAKWVATEWDHHKEKRTKGDRSSEESLPNVSALPEMISAKAAGRLGIGRSPSSHSTHSPSHASQSPGLILWPSTFIPISPFELEMHACKHLHSLIGCKAALTEFLHDLAVERHLSFDERMLDDLIWDYESFRRKRFNWPSECPDARLELESIVTPRSNTYRNSADSLSHHTRSRASSGSMGDPLFPREKLDFVRAIRVYSATKVDEEIHVL